MYQSIIIGTFSFQKNRQRTALNGMIEPLLSYFIPKTEKLILIDGTHPGSDSTNTTYEYYFKQFLIKQSPSIISILLSPLLKISNSNSTQIIFKVRDFLSTIEAAFLFNDKFDLFIGLESIFTLAGILLKKMGKINTVVYYVSDYTPQRYKNKLLNDIYLWLDRFCCKHSDYIWDVSPAMMSARIKAGFNKKQSAPCILTPNALFKKQISFLPVSKKKPYTLVFAGTFGPENGPKLAIEALYYVLKKNKKITLHFIGGGDQYEQELKNLVIKFGIEKNVIFHGFINDAIKVSQITKQAMVGIAPYRNIPFSPRLYADATKIRLYFGAGLPVITTNVPPLGKDKIIKKSLIVTKDNPISFGNAILKIFSSEKTFQDMRKNAIAYARKNTWENTYASTLKQMQVSYK